MISNDFSLPLCGVKLFSTAKSAKIDAQTLIYIEIYTMGLLFACAFYFNNRNLFKYLKKHSRIILCGKTV